MLTVNVLFLAIIELSAACPNMARESTTGEANTVKCHSI